MVPPCKFWLGGNENRGDDKQYNNIEGTYQPWGEKAANGLDDAKFYWKDAPNEYLQTGSGAKVDLSFVENWEAHSEWISPGVCRYGCTQLKAGILVTNQNDEYEYRVKEWDENDLYDADGDRVRKIVDNDRIFNSRFWGWSDVWDRWVAFTMCQIRI